MGHPFGQLRSAVPAVSPPTFLCTHSLLAGRAVWEAENVLTLCKHSSAATKTPDVIDTFLVTNPKHGTLQAAVRKIKSMPPKLSTLYFSCPSQLGLYLGSTTTHHSESGLNEWRGPVVGLPGKEIWLCVFLINTDGKSNRERVCQVWFHLENTLDTYFPFLYF